MKTILFCLTLMCSFSLSYYSGFSISKKIQGYVDLNLGSVFYSYNSVENQVWSSVPTGYHGLSLTKSANALDSRNENQIDIETSFADTYLDSNYSNIVGKSCVETASTIIIDYCYRYWGQSCNCWDTYCSLINYCSSSNGGNYPNLTCTTPEFALSILQYGLDSYFQVSLDYHIIHGSSAFSVVKNNIDNNCVTMLVNFGHAMVICGYVQYFLTYTDNIQEYVLEKDYYVINDVENNYNSAYPYNTNFWYHYTSNNNPGSNIGNYAFYPVEYYSQNSDYIIYVTW